MSLSSNLSSLSQEFRESRWTLRASRRAQRVSCSTFRESRQVLRASRQSCESLVTLFEPLIRPFQPLIGPFEPLAGASSFSSDLSGLSLNLSSLSSNLLGLSMGSTRGSCNPLDDRKRRMCLPARPFRDDDYSGRGRDGSVLRGRPRKGRRLNSASFSLRLPYCSRTKTRSTVESLRP